MLRQILKTAARKSLRVAVENLRSAFCFSTAHHVDKVRKALERSIDKAENTFKTAAHRSPCLAQPKQANSPSNRVRGNPATSESEIYAWGTSPLRR